MELRIDQISQLINGKIEGDGSILISKISPIDSAMEGSITFFSNKKYEPFLYTSQASAIILNDDVVLTKSIKPTLIRVKDSYLSFTTLLGEYQKIQLLLKEGIEQPVFLSSSASHGDNFYLGAFSHIGNNVKIGDNVKIYPHVTIGDNTTIGNNTVIYSGVKIYNNTKIGNYCTLQSGAVIGSDGFGFAPQPDGTYKSIPQVGNVIIEDHVDIGANTVVDCATFESTVIKKGVKLDNLIQIAHNVEIGENTVIAAQSGISGSTKIGKQCVIGGQVGIVGHITIGDKTKIQAQSGVNRSWNESSAIYGTPAIEYNNYLRSYAIFRKLPSLMKKIEEIEKNILKFKSIKL